MQATDPNPGGLLTRVIGACARHPWSTVLLVAVMAVWGWRSLRDAPLDAIPDLSDVQVIILTEWQGQSPDLIEDQLTYPISTSLLAAPKVKFVRGQSFFGLSFVYVIFEDGTDIYWARSRVLEYLNEVQGSLPSGVNPTLGPDATGVGWVFEYALVDRAGNHDLAELRSLQDWQIRYALESVPGVAEVASVGGYVRQYQVMADPEKLRSYGVTMRELIQTVRDSNEDVGGRTLEIGGHEHMIRGRGYVKTLEDLRLAPIKATPTGGGKPILVQDVAEVAFGPEIRRGIVDLNGDGQTVGGIVVMRYGENALSVIDAVKARLGEVERSLPEGVEVVITYDRSELIKDSIKTLQHTLLEEMIVVALIIFLFLMHARSALVPIVALPIAVLLAFIPMYFQGLTANIMSLGGIAVAIGAMVDASIIVIENIHKKLGDAEHDGEHRPMRETIIAAMQEVGPSIFYSLLVITVSFLPIFTLEATEGRLFKPLAYTKTYSMGFAAVLAVTLVPALAVLLIRGRIRGEDHNPINRLLVALYTPVVRFVVRWRWAVMAVAALLLASAVPVFLGLKSEFMPPLYEGAILYMPTAPPGISPTEAAKVVQEMDRELAKFPEVVSVFGKMGRARTATDPAPLGMAEITVVLKPKDEWRPGLSWDDLIAEMDERLQFPGMPNVWWQPIQTRTEMLATGIRSPLGIQIFGDDIATIERASLQIEEAIGSISGTRSAFAERATGGFYVDVEPRRADAARLGVRIADINRAVGHAIGGGNVTETVEGRERYPVSVRYAREFRENPEDLGDVLVETRTGAQVPLSQVADVVHRTGPPMIRSEDGSLVTFVFVDVSGRPIADYVQEAKAVVSELDLPSGVRVEYAGQYRYLLRAQARLATVLPLTLLLVLLLLYLNTRSWVETGIVLLAVPFSLIGAVWLLHLLDFNLSVGVWVGMIALAGLDAETGVIMLLYLTLAHKTASREGRMNNQTDLEEAIVEGAARRIRPKLMTVMTTMIGLLPLMWSSGTGADIMKRIAAPMVGGLVTSFLLELTVYPALFAFWKGRELRSSRSRG